MMKIKSALVVLVISIAVGWYWLNSNKTTVYTREIITEIVDQGDISRTVATSGSVRALVTVEVGSQLSGQIAELHADFNTPVKKDQLIALIDPQTFEKRVQQSTADLKVAEANVAVQKASISKAKANLRRSKLDYERQKPLVDKGTLAETTLDAALASYDSSAAELEMALAQLRNAEATLEQRKAGLSSVNIDLERTKILSPINGIVIERSVDVGQTVAASLSSPVLFKIAQDLREIQLEANVDEADIGNVNEGNKVTFDVDAFPDEKFTGIVSQIRLSPQELQNVVTYTVIIIAKNAEMKLLPGMTTNIEIITGKRENVLRVANDALRFRPRNANANSDKGPSSTSGFAATSTENRGGNRGAGEPGQMILQRLEALNLTEEQKTQIQQALSESMSQMFNRSSAENGFGDSPDRAATMARVRSTQEKILREYLSSEQFEVYRQQSSRQRKQKRGEVWIENSAGESERRGVILGISDDEYTEILRGDIEPGMEVITRIREKKSS